MKSLLAIWILATTAYAGTTWENTAGKRITATYLGIVGEEVYIQRDGREYHVALSDLSAESRAFALEMRDAFECLETSQASDLEFPEHILLGMVDAKPNLVEGRTVSMSGHIARLEGQGTLRGSIVEVVLQSGLRTEVDFHEEMQGGDYAIRIEGGRALLVEEPSPSNPFPSVTLLLEVGQPLTVRTGIAGGEVYVLKEAPAAPEEQSRPSVLKPVEQNLAVAYQRSARVYDAEEESESNGVLSEASLGEATTATDAQIDAEDLAPIPDSSVDAIGMQKPSVIRFNGRPQVKLPDGRYVDADQPSSETIGSPRSQTEKPAPLVARPISRQPRTHRASSTRNDLVHTGITFRGKAQVKLPDGRIMDEDQARAELHSISQGRTSSSHAIVRSQLPSTSVVVKDETGYRIKLSAGGYAALDSPEGRRQLDHDRNRDYQNYRIGAQDTNRQTGYRGS